MILFQYLISRPRFIKHLILLTTDVVMLTTALWLSFSLRLGEMYVVSGNIGWLFVAAPLLAIPVFIRFGLYRAIIRYLGMRAAWSVAQAVSLYAVLWGLLALLSSVPGIPRSVVLINAMVAMLLVGGSRVLARYIFNYHGIQGDDKEVEKRKVIIFGAGEAGRQLAVGLMQSQDYKLAGFVDESKTLHGLDLMGRPILSPSQLEFFVNQQQVSDLLLAMPSISRKERNRIIEQLRPLPVRIRTLPGLAGLARGEVNLNDLHDLDIEDLLARESAIPDEKLLQQQVAGKVIMITGAGGSIGSEICRQILKRTPKSLLLFEMNEFSLYTIHQELLGVTSKNSVNIVPLLGTVQDEARLEKIMQTWNVDMIYHAAAHKHVPLVENNVTEGVKNNVLGAFTVAKTAIEQGVPNLVLISTDKAVRPTNLMGATKRVAELTLQALVAEESPVFKQQGKQPLQVERKTHLSMVRFGNVLGSSGSVVPLFRKQIKDGGPITLTHKDIIRYFMTIPEASQLVMQAGAMSGVEDAAEVFVLDMGEPVKIYDLAKRMIELSGLRIKDEECPEGDIEIKVTGLRPGEKLYEELLIGDNPMPTQHPRIMKAHEDFIPWNELHPQLESLKNAADTSDTAMIRGILQELVKGYVPDEQIVDLIYCEERRKNNEGVAL